MHRKFKKGRQSQFSKMENNLIFQKLKTTSIFSKMYDYLNFFKMEYNLNFFRNWKTTSFFPKMEDDLNFDGDRRLPTFLSFKLKTTLIFWQIKDDVLDLFLSQPNFRCQTQHNPHNIPQVGLYSDRFKSFEFNQFIAGEGHSISLKVAEIETFKFTLAFLHGWAFLYLFLKNRMQQK